MIIPVRCFTCGKVIGGLYEEFLRRVQTSEKPADVLDSLGVERYCCRRIFMTHVELVDELAPYS